MATIAELFEQAVRHHQGGNLAQAESLYRQILRANPAHADAHHLLGYLAHQTGHSETAIALIRQAIALNPSVADFHANLGLAFDKHGQFAEAISSYQQALCLNPNDANTHYNLGNALLKQGRLDEAVACYRQALRINPAFGNAHGNLGIALVGQGQLTEAIESFRSSLRINPDRADVHNNLGNALRAEGRCDEALACFQQALRLKPNYAEAYCNLGNVRKDQGQLEECIAGYRKALELKPDYAAAHSSLIFALHFQPDQKAGDILEECRSWNQRHAEPLAKFILPHGNDKSPDRRLRIGYVSPDFRRHAVGQFLLPLLESHDHGQFEIFCYSSVTVPDAVTARCRDHADGWRPIFGLIDEQVAHLIREDRIDILVDLAMHTGHNRLLVFARKPAPVQVSYLAYCGTTGLATMDYRLTDPYLDPPGPMDRCYSEQSIRLPDTYWCYQPEVQTPEVNPLPALQAGHVTFGCLNNSCKATVPTLEAWSLLLQAMPEASLLLHVPAGSQRDRVRDFYTKRRVSHDRVEFIARVPTTEYYRAYQRIDVALDPFPYGGGTTTCDALWMGVPVVSLAGQTAVGRGGVSILSNVGLTELVASSVEEYVRIAVELAGDRPRLSQLRGTLRERILNSPLLDAPRFARNVEAAFRRMWRDWCAKKE